MTTSQVTSLTMSRDSVTLPVPNVTVVVVVGVENPYEQSWYVQAAYYTGFFALIIAAVGGNAIVTWIVLAHRRMRTVTNYFLVNLAVADLLISLLNTPLNFVYMLSSSWPFGAVLCRLSTLTAPLTISASVFTLMAIAIDRSVVMYCLACHTLLIVSIDVCGTLPYCLIDSLKSKSGNPSCIHVTKSETVF